MKEKVTYNVLLIITIITLFSMSLTLFGQDKNTAAGTQTTFDPGTEPVSGYWDFTGSTTNIVNGSKVTTWNTESNTLVAISGWIDVLKIEHTVSSSFKWEEPDAKLIPGNDTRLSGTYINNEYSTTNKIFTGIRIFVNKKNEGSSASNQTDEEILKVSKDNKSHVNEMKYGFFTAPRFFVGDSREMQLIVDCFIGNDHYITTYTYNWVESSSL